MPSDDFNFNKFAVGGCIPRNATVRCTNCEWENDEEDLNYMKTGEN